jgi:hypothetical protein
LTHSLVLLDMLQIDNLVFNGWGRRFFDSATVSLPVAPRSGWSGAMASANRPCSS